jgi:hypothetical protein
MQLFLTGVSLALVSSLYICITSMRKVPVAVAGFFLALAFDFSFIVHVPFRKLSLPLTESQELMHLAKMSGRQGKWMRAFMRSCTPIKLSLGDGGNFFDKLTSLVIWQFCVDLLITILLV